MVARSGTQASLPSQTRQNPPARVAHGGLASCDLLGMRNRRVADAGQKNGETRWTATAHARPWLKISSVQMLRKSRLASVSVLPDSGVTFVTSATKLTCETPSGSGQ